MINCRHAEKIRFSSCSLRYSCLPILSNRQSEIQELVRKSFVCTRLFVDASERHFLGEGCQSTTPVWHLAAKCTLDPHKKRPNFVANPMLPKYWVFKGKQIHENLPENGSNFVILIKRPIKDRSDWDAMTNLCMISTRIHHYIYIIRACIMNSKDENLTTTFLMFVDVPPVLWYLQLSSFVLCCVVQI